MLSVQQGLKDDGVAVPLVKLCQWFGVARRTMYYKPTRSPAKVKAELAEPIKELIEAEPSFGYRTVAALLGMNKNTVQRTFQLKGWQVRKRALGQRPRIEAKVSRAERPDQRWATDLCRVWGGKDGWLSLALVIDCSTRQLLCWHLSRTGGGEHCFSRAGAGAAHPLWHAGARA
jgi:putative transposase